MEFESPDVEKDFPGLYASESGRRSNESDFSDEAHDRPSKKDLLIGKRKDKKDSKKDRGYAALEGESSPEEDPEIKSPSKSKKSKSFKFPSSSKKEKREKSREKDCKEKEREVDKEKKKEKEKDGKVKLRLKERKKSKHGDDSIDVADEQTVFGIPLHLAVKRSRCHDGVDIPLVVRNSIDYIEEHGLKTESIYKISGIKSKVQHLRRMYNQREPVELSDYEVSAVTSLLKQFFRELPEPVLTTQLLPRFEEAAASKDVIDREIELRKMVHQLPDCNRQLLAWLLIHLENITQNDKHNKMNAQNIAITLSPVLQMSHRLLTALLCHCKSLFPNITLNKYIPPLSSGSPSLPESAPAITEELRKQESLLNQIHQEMNAGFVSKQKEEQLWEVQRIITQLKRNLRTVQRSRDVHQNQKSFEEDRSMYKSSEEEFHIDLTLQKAHSCSEEDTTTSSTTVQASAEPPNVKPLPCEENQADSVSPLTVEAVDGPEHLEGRAVSPQEDIGTDLSSDATEVKAFEPEEELQCLLQEEAILHVQHQELLHLQADLQGRVKGEREEIEKLRAQLAITKAKYNNYSGFGGDSTEGSSSPSLSDHSDIEDPQMERQIVELKNENFLLQQKKSNLVRHIMEEREMCLHLRVQLSLMRLSQESKHL